MQRAQILHDSTWYELRLGHYETACARGKEALGNRDELGIAKLDTLMSMALLALGLGYQGKLEESVETEPRSTKSKGGIAWQGRDANTK